MPADGRPSTWTVPRRIHIVGIGGAGMSAIAHRAAGHGPPGVGLGPEGLAGGRAAALATASPWRSGTGRGTWRGADAVTYSPAVQPENAELVEARRRGIRVVPRSEMLAAIAPPAAASPSPGTHGKTTTASDARR